MYLMQAMSIQSFDINPRLIIGFHFYSPSLITIMSLNGMAEATLSFKIILLGDSNVGKTCFLKQFIENHFAHAHPTVCVDFVSKTYQIDEFTVRLNIFDTAGQERYRALTQSYLKGTDAVLFMYSMERGSFENVIQWIKFFQENAEGRDEVRVLVGTKKDLIEENPNPQENASSKSDQERVLKSQIKQLVQANRFVFKFQTSAKTNLNINLVFEELCRNLIYNSIQKRKSANLIRESQWSLILKRDRDHLLREEQKNNSCC